jgi:hypothetical protein
MNFSNKIFTKILSIYFSLHLLCVPIIFLSHSNNISEYESRLKSELNYEALTSESSSNFNPNQNLYPKQSRSSSEIRFRVDRADLQYANEFYQVLTRLYSKKYFNNFNFSGPFSDSEISPTISRSPPLS